MHKDRYIFNRKTLTYERFKTPLKKKILSFIWSLAVALVFSAAVLLIAYTFLDSPKERILKREIAQYKLQLEVMNGRLDQLAEVVNDLGEKDDNIYRVIFEAEPIPSAVRKGGIGGVDRYSSLRGFNNSADIIATARKIDELSSQVYVQSKSFDEVFKLARNKADLLAAIPAIQPISNKDLRRLSSYFGYRIDPFYKVMKFHEGVDFTAPLGTDVFATGNGRVKSIERTRSGYGLMVIIDHGYGYSTAYAHLSKTNVKVGQQVTRGMVIAKVGNTGKSTSPHLHYEVRKGGKAIDPINYFFNDITPAQYEEIIARSSQPSQTMD